MSDPALPQPARLGAATLGALPASVQRPAYTRSQTRIGIVHLGVGAFHRAHQAAYIDDLLAIDPTWAICGVSLHSSDVRDALGPQDGLYTLVLLGEQPQLRIIGAITERLCARDQQAAVLARLADPYVRLVTLTITEKGYCLAGDGLDLHHPEIVRDLASPASPASAIGYLVAGLRLRMQRGIAAYSVLSCDNLADNGGRLRRAVLKYAQQVDAALAQWIEANGAFPRSMVDSITPATDAALRSRVDQALGLHDAWPVQREAFAQWVIEDHFCNGRPPLERVGVTISDNIAGYDRAKLRLLNGAHSSLAYLGLLLELETVGEAMRHPALAAFVEQLMREHIAPSLQPMQGFDPQRYISTILARFRNPAIQHKLAQIAWDGSQKIPVRLLGTISDALAAGRSIAALCLPVAAWMAFVRRQARDGVALVDPLGATLACVVRTSGADALANLVQIPALESIFGSISGHPLFLTAMRTACARLHEPIQVVMQHASQMETPRPRVREGDHGS